jgi:hypothetical protein
MTWIAKCTVNQSRSHRGTRKKQRNNFYGVCMKIDMHMNYFKKICIIIIFSLVGCANNNSSILKYHQNNIYENLTENAVFLYNTRTTHLIKKPADYYRCYYKINYGKSILDAITLEDEIPCSNIGWQPKVAYINDIAERIDFFSNNVYRQSIFLKHGLYEIGRYYKFNKSYIYYLYEQDNNYYDYFYCSGTDNICQISRFYRNEDILLHPVSESYEAHLMREKGTESKKKEIYR